MLLETPTSSNSLAPSPTLKSRYKTALRHAANTPFSGFAAVAWERLFTLNAAFYLGYWLAPEQHESLLWSLDRPFGLLGAPLPADPDHKIQALQHVAEIRSVAGMRTWAQGYAAPESISTIDHDAAVLAAGSRLLNERQSEAALHNFLVAHANRRLWQIAHEFAGANPALNEQTVKYMRQLARVAAAWRDPHLIQLAEAVLTEREELAYHPDADLLPDALSAWLA